MEAFVQRKRRKLSSQLRPPIDSSKRIDVDENNIEQSTEFKLAILASLHPDKGQDILLDYLLAYDGSVEEACNALSPPKVEPLRKHPSVIGYQSSLASFARSETEGGATVYSKQLTKKGRTLYLYSSEDIEKHTPCSIIHNFLPSGQAESLLRELLAEAPTFRKETFQLFDRTVESPHTMRFYVDSNEEADAQKNQYTYNGSYITDVAETKPEMLKVSLLVMETVNREIDRRGRKLKFQNPDLWKPNASFVNCYDGGKESVGYHSDQLTYLGPRAVIGSLSLGVAREFRVRRIVPAADVRSAKGTQQADEQGQISIHLPHNSLLIMHAEMQEEWKHAVAPAQTITPHPVAGNKRINITYRCYQPYLHPKYTPKCKCKVPAVLRCVQKRAATRGMYFWQCHAGYTPGQTGCTYFEWASFDEDGRPPWAEGYRGNANIAAAATTA
ncbi:2OG-Fe(II) oxygenase superfamily [Teratosphaeria destructans]|uniref:2OG-Fe(II) oxygenase superfamily n=1 Tax=Teratosphaeria destructans TaxID=418781 RepID=A0A9W7W8F3_9PEZI|nr:2OG-Fe(II) oxygenase superfamily [Teratosphaeria destructans]